SEAPGAYTLYQEGKLKILKTELHTEDSDGKPGTIASLCKNIGIYVNTVDKQLLITQLQAAGKKVMSAWAWQLGSRIKPGDCFGRQA
ncbi:MAG: methionyl-tRNA formyltransferase, partial [Candidatus Cloacimonadaceae bacterium]|nr:methionyl-tRNA formyltransferase [Candidatus Cloacimonadaceae bacterium]